MNRMRCVGHVARNKTVTKDSYNILVLQSETNQELCNLCLDRIAVASCTLQHVLVSCGASAEHTAAIFREDVMIIS
jgi:hypothetical protein